MARGNDERGARLWHVKSSAQSPPNCMTTKAAIHVADMVDEYFIDKRPGAGAQAQPAKPTPRTTTPPPPIAAVVYLSPADNSAGPIWNRPCDVNRTVMPSYIVVSRHSPSWVPWLRTHTMRFSSRLPTSPPLTPAVAAAMVARDRAALLAASTRGRSSQPPLPASTTATAWLSPCRWWAREWA